MTITSILQQTVQAGGDSSGYGHRLPISSELRWNRRFTKALSQALLCTVAVALAIFGPMVFALNGIGMSLQPEKVATDTSFASFLAMFSGFIIIRRFLNFPLLNSHAYVVVTFASTFSLVATTLKFFRINFSNPQFFLSMIAIAAGLETVLLIQRRWKPMRIAVVPGGLGLCQGVKSHQRPVEFAFLSRVPEGSGDYAGIIADLSSELTPEWEHFLAQSALCGIPVYHVKHFNESMTGRVTVDHLWENTLGGIVPSLIYPQFKRAIDLVLTVISFPMIALIVAVCAVIIKLDSPGPVFFRQRRVGLGAKTFTICKLRTMKHGDIGNSYTSARDVRITRVGEFLRLYRIDELPQVINILRGDMSWIGPRPEAVSLAQWYEQEIPFYVYRHIVRPGISGWAQVNQGNVSAIDAIRQKLEYDFFYIKHFSFWLDAIIFVKTLRTLVLRFGSR
jgi:lipopolysaccharide/colanic/teichoic acid biosynthesis glycosyltransferase